MRHLQMLILSIQISLVNKELSHWYNKPAYQDVVDTIERLEMLKHRLEDKLMELDHTTTNKPN